MAVLPMTVDMTDDLADLYAGVSVSIVRFTPEVAAEYLERNTKNRPISKGHVKHFVHVMRHGDMMLNGEAIIVDIHGTVLNGQHRLTACVESGLSFDCLVVFGIDPGAFKTIDGGKKRKTSDALAIQGEIYFHRLAAAVQALISFVEYDGRIYNGGKLVSRSTPQCAERVLQAHPGLRDSVSAMVRSKLMDNQHGYLLHYLFRSVDRRLSDDFVTCLSGPHEDVGRPFVLLREALIAMNNRNAERREQAAKCIKAFNAELCGARPKMLRFASTEDFPTIDGLDYEKLAETV